MKTTQREMLRKRIALKLMQRTRNINNRKSRYYKAIPADVKAKLNAVSKGIQVYQETKSRLEDTFSNTLDSILRGVSISPDGENIADNIRIAYKNEVLPLLDKMLYEDAYWHFEAIIDLNLNNGE